MPSQPQQTTVLPRLDSKKTEVLAGGQLASPWVLVHSSASQEHLSLLLITNRSHPLV